MKRVLFSILSIVITLGMTAAFATPAAAADVDLLAGQDIKVGTVSVSNTISTVIVSYAITEEGWVMTESHLEVAAAPEDIPQTKKGNPKPGKFTYSDPHGPVTAYTYEVPLPEGAATLFIAAHAEVVKVVDDVVEQEESAWADGMDFDGKNWATYVEFEALQFALEAKENATAEWRTNPTNEGDRSLYLYTGEAVDPVPGTEARINITLPTGTTLGDIQSISWNEYLVKGYPPHVDISLDTDCDGVTDDKLNVEYAYNFMNHYADTGTEPYNAQTGNWYQTFDDDNDGPPLVDDNTGAWLNSGAPGPPGGAGFIFFSLADWKAGQDLDGDNAVDINEDTCVLSLEIEVDNWIAETEAYVDDIVVTTQP